MRRKRFFRRALVALALTLTLGGGRPGLAAIPAAGAYAWRAADGTEIAAELRFFEVPEDRQDPASRPARLAYVRLPTTARRPGSPIVYLAGGPGASGIDSARGARASMLLALREVGDVILLDQRGTGWSAPLRVCNKSWEPARDQPLEETAARAELRAAGELCAEQMKKLGVRFDSYSLGAIAEDIEALRHALGAKRLSLVATSYGTRVALEVLRRRSATIDRAILLGVVGPDRDLKSPAAADAVLDGFALPDGRSLRSVLAARLSELKRQPLRTTAVDVLTGEDVAVAFGPLDLQLLVTEHLVSADQLLELREIVAQWERGDKEPLVQNLLRQRKRWLGPIMPYAAFCSAAASPARQRQVAGEAAASVVGRQLDYWYPDVCTALAIEPLAASAQPVASRIPVLVVSGTLDARTPARNGEEVLRHLPRGIHLVIEGAGHGDDLLVSTPLIARRANAFLRGEKVVSERLRADPPTARPLPRPPGSDVVPVVDTLNGVEITDPYRWLENSKTPEVRVWTRQQNAYTDRLLHVLPRRFELRQRLAELTAGTSAGLPTVRGPRSVYRAETSTATLPALMVDDGQGPARVLVDPKTFDTELGRAAVELLSVSKAGDLAAFAVRRNGAEEVAVRFVRVDGGALLRDELPTGRYFGVAVALDSLGAYYSRELANGEGTRLRYHRFGTDPAADPVIFGEGYGRGSIIWGNLSDDGQWLASHAVSGTRRQIDVFLDRVGDQPGPEPPTTGHDLSTRRTVVSDIDAPFYAGVLGDRLVIHTTWEAPRGRIYTASLDHPGREHWREIVPQHATAVIQKVFGAGGRILVEYLDNIQSRLAVFDLEGRSLGDVPLPGPGSIGSFSGRFGDPVVYFAFSSFHVPGTIYRYELESGRLEPWRQAVGGLDLDAFVVEQRWVTSRDATRVPMFVIHRKGIPLDGSHPTLISVYGGFATSLTPSYQPQTAWWVENGGVWVVANVRGGAEFGAEWHQAAVREHKQRSIDDLLAVAQGVVDMGFTRPERLALWGHSNGGLLVAAAMVQRPELFRAVVSTHPLLDMLRYNQFLAARFWLAEFGSPERPDFFPALRAYSPYHNVRDGVHYPAVFLETSYADTQVAPLHARKMAARLQAVAAPNRPVVLRHHQKVGHGGEGVSLDERIDELVDTLSFLRWQLGF